MTADSAPSGTSGAIKRMSVAPTAAGTPCSNKRETCGATSHRPTAAAVPMSATGMTAITTIRRTSASPPIARAREIHLVRPVSAPSSKVFDKIVYRAISSKNTPAPRGCSHRLASTTSPKLIAAPSTMATRLTSEPRATTADAADSPRAGPLRSLPAVRTAGCRGGGSRATFLDSRTGGSGLRPGTKWSGKPGAASHRSVTWSGRPTGISKSAVQVSSRSGVASRGTGTSGLAAGRQQRR